MELQAESLRREMGRTPAGGPVPVAFRSQGAFRAWLDANHAAARELVVRCFKIHAADQGLTYAQALDEALCVGWIDGIRRAADAESFSVRFTPRKPRSVWSQRNLEHVERLRRAGRMTAPGLAAYEARQESRTGVYSFENRARLSPAFTKSLRANREAWAYFETQAPWYRRTSAYWVMSAKRAETRARRLESLIAYSAKGEPIPPLKRVRR
jgi:uncharacterized protein YdeI (YjbR/CyaY-like superfamily)